MDSSAIGGGMGGAQGPMGNMAAQMMAGGAQVQQGPQAMPGGQPGGQDDGARAAAMQAQGKGQKIDITA